MRDRWDSFEGRPESSALRWESASGLELELELELESGSELVSALE